MSLLFGDSVSEYKGNLTDTPAKRHLEHSHDYMINGDLSPKIYGVQYII